MRKYHLAIDIGASSGRHLLGFIENGIFKIEEVYRFENSMKARKDTLYWDVESLFQEILSGMKKCQELGKVPETMGIDTWGVDFVLLDKNNKILGEAVGYRDSRTKGMDQKVFEVITEEALYERTGIQKQCYNSIYQLMAVKEKHPKHLANAESMLMIPDYFHFLLTGEKAIEYTIGSTTQLISPKTKDWDFELIQKLGLPQKIFTKVAQPGTYLGNLTQEIQQKVGYDCKVILPASHDTGSAVLAVPSNNENTLYISSGTWSLMGVELKSANCSVESKSKNFTNEGGYDNRFRYLKNIMGLWMIQSVRREYHDKFTYAELCLLAEQEKEFPSIVDVNNERFLAPESMIEEIQSFCKENFQKVPETVGQVAAVVYHSLARCYGETLDELEKITGVPYPSIHIMGGGCNAEYLNQLTAEITKKTVFAGPIEATAIGNITCQMLAEHEFVSVEEARNCIFKSFEIKEYK